MSKTKSIAAAAGVALMASIPDGAVKHQQERAYTSPIWHSPG